MPFHRYVALGDSFAEGVGDPDPDAANGLRGWADRVAAVLAQQTPDFGYANLAIRGRKLDSVLAEQIEVSLDLARACTARLRELPDGPVSTKLPKVLKVPEGSHYLATENPLGFNGYYLVSRGEKAPHRLKLRSASFNNVQVLTEMLPGTVVADMVAILGSMFFVVGDVDR